jgi:copper homeostasis protein
MILEVCTDSVMSALEAQKGGADRVELCANLDMGGTTPGISTIRMARKNLETGLFVLIRPRAGDFLYSDMELEIMKEDILAAREAGADGVIFGILTPKGQVDMKRTTDLITLARPMQVTFHRAFDMTRDPFQSLEDIISLGIERILTSGQKKSAIQGASLIRLLVDQAGNRIGIMPGGGISETNIRQLAFQTGAAEFHASLRKYVLSEMEFRNEEVCLGDNPCKEYETMITDTDHVKKVKDILEHFGK